MGPRVSLDGRKISSQPGFDPGPSSPTELPGPRLKWYIINERGTGKGVEGGLVIAEDLVLYFCGRIEKSHYKSQSQ